MKRIETKIFIAGKIDKKDYDKVLDLNIFNEIINLELECKASALVKGFLTDAELETLKQYFEKVEYVNVFATPKTRNVYYYKNNYYVILNKPKYIYGAGWLCKTDKGLRIINMEYQFAGEL